jgi:hypothetical protein
VLTATGGLQQIRFHYTGENRDLLRVLLNAVSATEANLALDVMKDTVPEKTLITACNLREVLSAVPRSPFPMRVDECTLCKVAGLERSMAAMGKVLPDGVELHVTTAGNLVMDIIVKAGGEKHFWSPFSEGDDFVSSAIVDLTVASQYLLDAVIDLTKTMGVEFNPRFYLSLEDWHMDNAHDVFQGIGDLF